MATTDPGPRPPLARRNDEVGRLAATPCQPRDNEPAAVAGASGLVYGRVPISG